MCSAVGSTNSQVPASTSHLCSRCAGTVDLRPRLVLCRRNAKQTMEPTFSSPLARQACCRRAIAHHAFERFDLRRVGSGSTSGIDHTDRFSGHTPFHFLDLSDVRHLRRNHSAGAQLHLVPGDTVILPLNLRWNSIRTSQLTQWFLVPLACWNAAWQSSTPCNKTTSCIFAVCCGAAKSCSTPALIY